MAPAELRRIEGNAVKNAIVTGAQGFVGRHMVRELHERGYRVFTYDVPDSDWLEYGRHGHVNTIPSIMRNGLDLLVHAAGVVGGRAGIDGNKGLLAQNLELDAFTFNVLPKIHPHHMVYLSSSAVYPTWLQWKGNQNRLGESLVRGMEATPADYYNAYPYPSPDADYGLAKLIGEQMAARVNERAIQQGMFVTVVRPFSGYGEDQSDDYPFPSIVKRAFRKTTPLHLWGDVTQVRDWVHISDVANAILAIVDSGGSREPVNICTGIGTSMQDLATMAWRIAGHDLAELAIASVKGPEGVHTRVGDPTAMLRYYTPKVTIEEGVTRMIEYLRSVQR